MLGNEADKNGGAVEIYISELGYHCFNDPDDPDCIRKPDLSVIRSERLKGLGDVGDMPIPADLAVEVLSPNDLWRKVETNRREYLTAGCGAAWIFDPGFRSVWVWKSDGSPTFLRESDRISAEPAMPGVTFAVADFFK